MSSPFSDTVAPRICRTHAGALDHACYERRARQLRAAALQRWIDLILGLFASGIARLRTYSHRIAQAREIRQLEGAALRDLGLSSSDMSAIADGSFASDPTRRPRGWRPASPPTSTKPPTSAREEK